MNAWEEPHVEKPGVSDQAVTFALRCLELPSSCVDTEQMKASWKKMLWEFHPDRCDDPEKREANEKKMQMINAAKDLLEQVYGSFG